MNPTGGSQEFTLFELCREFRCLPSQLEKENATTIESFIILLDSLRLKEISEKEKIERENKLLAGGIK